MLYSPQAFGTKLSTATVFRRSSPLCCPKYKLPPLWFACPVVSFSLVLKGVVVPLGKHTPIQLPSAGETPFPFFPSTTVSRQQHHANSHTKQDDYLHSSVDPCQKLL
jgi:hypothetical protein